MRLSISVSLGSILVVAFFNLVSSQLSIKVANCGGSKNINVTVTPCTAEPCTLKKGSVATVQASFLSNQDSNNLRLKITAKVRDFNAPFPGLRSNSCRGQGLTCPLNSGKPYTFKYGLRILAFYPDIKTNATFTVIGDKGTVFCFTAPVEIK